jgi:integrase
MAKSLTVKSVEAIKPSSTRQEIGDGGAVGLWLVVQPTGAKSWGFRYRSPIDGKPKKLTIGPFPAYGLADARAEAGELRRQIGKGVDPAQTKKAAKTKAADTSRDVSALLDLFLKRHVATKKASTEKMMRQQIEADIRPAWSKRRIDTITRGDVSDLLDAIVERGATVHANRVFSLVRKFLNWCVDRGVIERSPAQGMSRPAEEAARDRVLTEVELRWLWSAAKVAGNFGACIRLLLLTGQRRMEIGAMVRSELGLQASPATLTIPPARTKNGREHMVPLTDTAVEIINSVPRIGQSDLIFTTDGETVSSGWSKSKSRLDALMLAAAREEAEKAGREPPDALRPWTIHDLRRTCASGLAKLRQPPHVIEAILNHASGQISGIAAVYNVYEYQDEKAAALVAWEKYLLRVGEGQGANVIPMREAV